MPREGLSENPFPATERDKIEAESPTVLLSGDTAKILYVLENHFIAFSPMIGVPPPTTNQHSSPSIMLILKFDFRFIFHFLIRWSGDQQKQSVLRFMFIPFPLFSRKRKLFTLRLNLKYLYFCLLLME